MIKHHHQYHTKAYLKIKPPHISTINSMIIITIIAIAIISIIAIIIIIKQPYNKPNFFPPPQPPRSPLHHPPPHHLHPLRMLETEGDVIDLGSVDPLGRSALLMGIDNENLDMVSCFWSTRWRPRTPCCTPSTRSTWRPWRCSLTTRRASTRRESLG